MSTPSEPAVYLPPSLITLVSTATNGRAYWLYFFVDEARANMEHNIITLELSIQIFQAIKSIQTIKLAMLLYIYCLMGPVVSKHVNLGPVDRARGAGSPTYCQSPLNADLGIGCEWNTSME